MNFSIQVPRAEHYGHAYESKKRLASYWHQIDECLALGGKSALMVGQGSGLPSILLERGGFKVTTVDIQRELEPTVLGDVRHLPFADRAFDIAICCEVLEHLPFECFLPSLFELKRVVRRGVVLSLPDRGPYSKVLPYVLFRRKTIMNLPSLWLETWTFEGGHFWEVGTRGHRLNDIQHKINEARLKLENTFRVWEFPYHRFWRLSIREPGQI